MCQLLTCIKLLTCVSCSQFRFA
ncbi:hypothetical protein V12B01_12840 [Vibrio splendidus 12B01]|nr:hypothetical protein V12B01_12840 [Vibrio splendidus 12B01]